MLSFGLRTLLLTVAVAAIFLAELPFVDCEPGISAITLDGHCILFPGERYVTGGGWAAASQTLVLAAFGGWKLWKRRAARRGSTLAT